MCGRYTYSARAVARAARQMGIDHTPPVEAWYNVAPTTNNPVILHRGGVPVVELLRWGLVPSWSKDSRAAAKMINARAETVAEKPAFRSAFKARRCLVITNGFYEWRQDRQPKQPCRFYLPDDEPMIMAGLWESWRPPDGEPLQTFSIITTEANETVAPVHNRMPVVLEPEDWTRWLDPAAAPEALAGLLRPWPAPLLVKEVTTRLNKVSFQGQECHEPDPSCARDEIEFGPVNSG